MNCLKLINHHMNCLILFKPVDQRSCPSELAFYLTMLFLVIFKWCFVSVIHVV